MKIGNPKMLDMGGESARAVAQRAVDIYNWTYFHQHLLLHDKDYAFEHAVMGLEYMKDMYTVGDLTARTSRLNINTWTGLPAPVRIPKTVL